MYLVLGAFCLQFWLGNKVCLNSYPLLLKTEASTVIGKVEYRFHGVSLGGHPEQVSSCLSCTERLMSFCRKVAGGTWL